MHRRTPQGSPAICPCPPALRPVYGGGDKPARTEEDARVVHGNLKTHVSGPYDSRQGGYLPRRRSEGIRGGLPPAAAVSVIGCPTGGMHLLRALSDIHDSGRRSLGRSECRLHQTLDPDAVLRVRSPYQHGGYALALGAL